jgi:hypothetical protein
VTKRTFGILATVVGSAVGAWWYTSQRRSRGARQLLPARERGTVIFDNTPTATSSEGII